MRLLTGFPGFLGSEFIVRLLRSSDARFLVLVQEKFIPAARAKIAILESALPGASARIEIVSGDITLQGLGIQDHPKLSEITEVDHFAAVYDLSVAKEVAEKINVEGTRNILDFIQHLPNFRALHYVSTCYVSGRHPGRFLESDLNPDQAFNNFYESTKARAEALVRERMNSGLPAVIYRPSIVVGDSRTGETQKFDGPYYVMQWLLRQGKYAILPALGNPSKYTINLVPSNYVLDAMAFLAQKSESIGKTFALSDPNPHTINEVVQILAKACGKILVSIPLPKTLAKWSVKSIPGLESWLGIPATALDYFVHPTAYDCGNTIHALKGTGITCPRLEDYAPVLVEFRKNHPELRSKAMI